MLDEDADDDDYTEEDEDDDDHDEDDQDDEDVEEDMVIDAQEGEEDVDWVDHAAIIELINETEGSNQNTGWSVTAELRLSTWRFIQKNISHPFGYCVTF